ncbi:39S ribosomal protein S18a, mitochondrial-like [Mya arenaria]|uniref:39S ribosomal protein S18a, mitochondrial-like n=1 Tax=Mya arenaria TaxID=6604 RepID=UPI0022E62133|nr:39S ribosomal protein S18a, mitochondrial-like [Mya arenaria]
MLGTTFGSLRFINSFHKLSFQICRNRKQLNDNIVRSIKTSSSLHLREVVETTNGNVTVIEGRKFDSDRKDQLLKVQGAGEKCVLCRLNLDIKYTDVLILSQFLREDGDVVSRQLSGLCYHQQSRIKKLVHQAHSAGLMQNLRPHVFPDEYSQMSDYKWKKYNVYYNEAIEDGTVK